jgi:hypothetical protein
MKLCTPKVYIFLLNSFPSISRVAADVIMKPWICAYGQRQETTCVSSDGDLHQLLNWSQLSRSHHLLEVALVMTN